MTEGPRGTWETDLARVRLVLARELETISVYEALARQAESAEAKTFFEHLALEEKEHVAEATYLLRKLDPSQDSKFETDYSQEHFAGAAPPREAPNAILAPPVREAPAGTSRAPYIPEDLPLPAEPHRALYALPAPTSETAGVFTVGPLKKKR